MGRKRIFAAALALALALSGCVQAPEEPPEEPPAQEQTREPELPGTDPDTYSKADSLFSVNYVSTASMNPFKGTNTYNQQVFGLIYESLFELTPELQPVPVLCENYSTEDGIKYFITVKKGVTFHNGQPLTAGDVVYSINYARNTSKYSSRLDVIAYTGLSQDGKVEIHLKKADYGFPALLTIPIVPTDTADEDTPPGSGLYRLSGAALTQFRSHRDSSSDIPASIYLREIDETALAEAFSERAVDLVSYDPNASSGLNIHMVHETRYYDTTDLLYLGFNCNAKAVNDILVRRALLRLVDKDAIVEECYGNDARKSPFILNPALGLYDEVDTRGYNYSRQDFQRLALVAGLEDTDFDGFLEYGEEDFELRFIVNSESEAKVAAARRIATDMLNMGVNVTLDELGYSQYEAALNAGNFGMYLAEVRLKADFDMSALFSGKLNYGKIKDPEYASLAAAFLAAPEEGRQEAAEGMDLYVAEDASLIPILYRQRLVLTHLGVIQGLSPSLSNVFAGMAQWKVTLNAGQ